MTNSPSSKPKRKVGLLTCIFLVMAIMVGNGIYTSLGMQLISISSGFTILVLWGVAGICALCGALSYAELASLMPHSGGEYYYLSRIYHPALGTMAGFIAQMAGFVGPIALASMAFGKYLQAFFPGSNPMISSMILVTVITGMHLITLGFSAVFQDLITGLKFFLIAIIFYLGFSHAHVSPALFLPSKGAVNELLSPSSGVALIFCFYAYSGWNSATYIADDVTSSYKTVGRSLILGSLLVILIYMLMNALFLMAAPVAELRGVLDVGHVVANHLLGEKGGQVMTAMIAIGLLAGVSAMVWVGPHITQMMGKDLPALRFLAPVSKGNVPISAMLIQYVLVMILLTTGAFKMVLVATQFPIIFCEFLGVIGVIVLRYQHRKIKDPTIPKKEREGFKCPLYPLPPLFFGIMSIVVLSYTMFTNPLEGIIGVVIILVAISLYPLLHRESGLEKRE